jgi:FlaA1/EpsC-like NDP-sugar epimerase
MYCIGGKRGPCRCAAQYDSDHPSGDYALFYNYSEAALLVLGAFAVGEHGDIMVLVMSALVKIVVLARNLVRLSGQPAASVRIEFEGLRPGAKLLERLHYPSTTLVPTFIPEVSRTQSRAPP